MQTDEERQKALQGLWDRQQVLLGDLKDLRDGIDWNPNLVSRVCAAMGGLMEHLSLTHTPEKAPLVAVRIVGAKGHPVLRLETDGLPEVSADEVGAFIGPTVGLSGEKATVAWRSLESLLAFHPGVLPGVEPFGYRPMWDYVGS